MTNVMTPSAVKDEQVQKAVSNYRAMLEKYQHHAPSDAFQQVLGDSAFAKEQFEVLRRRVETISKMVVRTVRVDRTRTGERMLQAVRATRKEGYIEKAVLSTMRHVGTGDEVTLHYHNFGRQMPVMELKEEVRKLGRFRLADPFETAAGNEDDPTLADTHPNGTQWVDEDGNSCYVAFFRWFDGRGVDVRQLGNTWYGRWFFPLVRIDTLD